MSIIDVLLTALTLLFTNDVAITQTVQKALTPSASVSAPASTAPDPTSTESASCRLDGSESLALSEDSPAPND